MDSNSISLICVAVMVCTALICHCLTEIFGNNKNNKDDKDE